MKRHAPATTRNSAAIAQVLQTELPEHGTVLEIASGTGEHAVYFARVFPQLQWQPSDEDTAALLSIEEWGAESALTNLLPPIHIHAADVDWPVTDVAAVLCINMVHISPWHSAEGLFRNAGRILASGAPLILYGPFLEAGTDTAPSNLEFDASLKARDPRWGLRDVSALDVLAEASGLERTARHAMPANNLTVVYRRK